MNKLIIALRLAIALPGLAQAQSTDSAGSRTADNISKSGVTVNVENGLTITDKSQKFSLNVKARMAGGVGLDLNEDGQATNTNFALHKARLNLSGYMFSEKLTYSLQFGFAPADTKVLPNGNNSYVRDAVIHYKPNSSWQLSFGQTKVKANRAHMNSSQLLAFTGRSIVDSPFQQDRDFGFFAEYSHKVVGSLHVALKGSVTSGEGRDYGVTQHSGLNYTGRVELYPLGRFEGNGAFSEPDLVHEKRPRLMIGGAYSHNDRALRLGGQTGSLATDGGHDLNQYYADVTLKYQGFSLQGDLMGRNASDVVISNGQYIYKGYGYNVQASYNLPCRKWTMALRNSTLVPAASVRAMAGYKQHNQSTAAVTYHLRDHRIKVQAEASYNHLSEATTAYNRWQFGMMLEFGM